MLGQILQQLCSGGFDHRFVTLDRLVQESRREDFAQYVVPGWIEFLDASRSEELHVRSKLDALGARERFPVTQTFLHVGVPRERPDVVLGDVIQRVMLTQLLVDRVGIEVSLR